MLRITCMFMGLSCNGSSTKNKTPRNAYLKLVVSTIEILHCTSKPLYMKKFVFAISCFSAFLFQGCLKDKITHTYTVLTPIYETKEVVRGNIKSNAPKDIQSPGKIFIYGNYIFLNELNKGVHVIDNTNPSNPVAKAFIDIPGNVDIAVKGNTLYADMYGDLVSVDITDPLNAKLLKDIPNIFPERSYEGGFVPNNNMVIVGWNKKVVTEKVQTSKNYIVVPGIAANFLSSADKSSSSSAPVGIGGSLARFSIVNDYLYAVDHHTLRSILIKDENNPQLVATTSAGFDIETIYPLKDKLFIGSMGGLYIYDVSNPAAPVSKGVFVHARACDPVVADDHYAYVTLRAGTTCGPTTNELQVVNITDLSSPTLLKSYAMNRPQGLSKDGNTLFVCDGSEGLKVFNAADASDIRQLKQIKDIQPTDVIAWNGNALVVTQDGLYQYDYSDWNNIHLRSKLTILK